MKKQVDARRPSLRSDGTDEGHRTELLRQIKKELRVMNDKIDSKSTSNAVSKLTTRQSSR